MDQVQERLHAIAWLPARGSSGREGLLVARVDEYGRLTRRAWVQLGLAGERRVALQQLAGVARTDRRLPLASVSSTSTTTARVADRSAMPCCEK